MLSAVISGPDGILRGTGVSVEATFTFVPPMSMTKTFMCDESYQLSTAQFHPQLPLERRRKIAKARMQPVPASKHESTVSGGQTLSTTPSHQPERLSLDPFPRPQMQRSKWMSLDGAWQFFNGRGSTAAHPEQVQYDAEIQIPFSPETPSSGINDTGFYTSVWYRPTWDQPELPPGHRLHIHFEAVDWRATVWVNGRQVCTHEGGYTPFRADITDVLRSDGPPEVVVR